MLKEEGHEYMNCVLWMHFALGANEISKYQILLYRPWPLQRLKYTHKVKTRTMCTFL